MAILRFAIASTSDTDVHTVLQLRQAVMMLENPSPAVGAAEEIRLISNTGEDLGQYNPKVFIKGVLDRFIGKSEGEQVVRRRGTLVDPTEGDIDKKAAQRRRSLAIISAGEAMWCPDAHSDRLFTFTLGAIDGLGTDGIAEAAFRFGNPDAKPSETIHSAVVDTFVKMCLESKFAKVPTEPARLPAPRVVLTPRAAIRRAVADVPPRRRRHPVLWKAGPGPHDAV